jgi:transposase
MDMPTIAVAAPPSPDAICEAVAAAVVIVLTGADEAILTARIRAARTERRDLIRARIVLAAAIGQPNAVIAATLAIHVDTVRKWRSRFAEQGLAGLADLPRSGRPRVFTDVQAAGLKAMACELPAESDLPLSRWSSADLATEAVTRGIVDSISASTVRRWLNADAIKPWQHRSWIFPRDPDFKAKATRVLDLYARTWHGRDLGENEYVISADEKSQLQALRRRHPDQAPARNGPAGSSSNTPAAAPWPTSLPTTSTTPASWARSRRRPGSRPSPSSSST